MLPCAAGRRARSSIRIHTEPNAGVDGDGASGARVAAEEGEIDAEAGERLDAAEGATGPAPQPARRRTPAKEHAARATAIDMWERCAV
jgi:hypothetical protein